MLRASVVASVFVSLLWPSTVEAAGRVWIVGPGAPSRTIQSAVDAASDGDVVLVQSGTYAGFSIDGKALAVVRDGVVAPLVVGPVLIERTPAGSTSLLDGLTITSTSTSTPALRTRKNAGAVRIQHCVISGRNAAENGYVVPGGVGMSSEQDGDVALLDTDVFGGFGTTLISDRHIAAPGPGGNALATLASTLAAFDCTFRGGAGGDDQDEEGWDGENGGRGLAAMGGTISLTGCASYGGSGGGGGGAGGRPPFGHCPADGGNGGDGLFAGGPPAVAGAIVRIQDCVFTGGAAGPGGGPSTPGSGCSAGAPGAIGHPITVNGGVVIPLDEHVRMLRGAALAREGTKATLTFAGAPGDQVYFAVSADWRSSNADGSTQDELHKTARFVGTIPPAGVLTRYLPIGDVVHGAQARSWVLHPSFVDIRGGVHIANDLVWVIVDSGI